MDRIRKSTIFNNLEIGTWWENKMLLLVKVISAVSVIKVELISVNIQIGQTFIQNPNKNFKVTSQQIIVSSKTCNINKVGMIRTISTYQEGVKMKMKKKKIIFSRRRKIIWLAVLHLTMRRNLRMMHRRHLMRIMYIKLVDYHTHKDWKKKERVIT